MTKSKIKSTTSPKLTATTSLSSKASPKISPVVPSTSNTNTNTNPGTSSSATLQVFWDLAKEDPNERTNACQLLIQSLLKEQKLFEKNGNQNMKTDDEDENDSDEEMKDETSTNNSSTSSSHICTALSYALKRLCRGLASSRSGARSGFALALTEILSQFPQVKTEEVLKIVNEQINLEKQGNRQVRRVRTISLAYSHSVAFWLRFFPLYSTFPLYSRVLLLVTANPLRSHLP